MRIFGEGIGNNEKIEEELPSDRMKRSVIQLLKSLEFNRHLVVL